MQKHTIPYTQVGSFSKIFLDYVAQLPDLHNFYAYNLSYKSCATAAEYLAQQQHRYNRAVLHNALQKQYAKIPVSQATQSNITALSQPNSFAVVTAHQPNLFTGPLYFVYKIASTIALSNKLNALYPQYRFVPIYWMGSEDHDFAEVNHINIYGKTLTWDIPNDGSAVGKINTKSLTPVLDELQMVLGNDAETQQLMMRLRHAYIQQTTLGQATQYWVNDLFGEHGLVVIDQDDRDLKQLFLPIIEQELIEKQSQHWVQQTNAELQAKDYATQAFPRPINLFYHHNQGRKRIVWNEESQYFELNDEQPWKNIDQIKEHLCEAPDKFSPNVILRPLYQQTVLPAVAYVGGGGELAYWLQLKRVFDNYGVHYPVLVPRNSALWIDEHTTRRMQRTDLTVADLFRNAEKLAVEYINKHTRNQLHLFAQKEAIRIAFEQILQRAIQIDPTLQSAVVGETIKTEKAIEALEAKMLRAEKRHFDTATTQIKQIKEKIFPKGQLQERHDNMLPIYLRQDKAFIELLINTFDPIESQFWVFSEDGE